MTNTTQTDLLDGVEPDAFIDGNNELSIDKIRGDDEGMIRISKVESLLEAHRAEIRKQVLMEAADYFMRRNFMVIENGTAKFAEDELRRMAESTMEGEKSE